MRGGMGDGCDHPTSTAALRALGLEGAPGPGFAAALTHWPWFCRGDEGSGEGSGEDGRGVLRSEF